MHIAVDIDGVLADLIPALLQYHNDQYGSNFIPEQVTDYRLTTMWGGTLEEEITKVYAFYLSDRFPHIQPVPGAVDGIRRLKKDHQLSVITSRPEHIIDLTEQWLTRYFPEAFGDVHHTSQYSIHGGSQKKHDICRELNIDFLVEDNLEYALEAAKQGVSVIVLDYPWNQGVLPAEVQRAYSWQDLVNKF